MIQSIAPNTHISLEASGNLQMPALVLLHAFPLSSAMWEEQRRFFSPTFRVITPDVRGVGDSSSFGQAPSVSQMAEDLAALLDSLGVERAIVGGCSMGGYAALEFARQFPERLRGLILCDTRADADTEEAKKARDEMIAFAKENGGRAVAEKMLPKLLSDPTREGNPEIAQHIKDWATSSGECLADLVVALRDRRDSMEMLSQIQVPTLVVGGEFDVPSPPEVMAQMAQRIARSKHVVIKNAGHLSSIEQPERWNSEVQTWLRENELII